MPHAMERRRAGRRSAGAAVLGRGVLALALVTAPAAAHAGPPARDPGALAAEGQARRDAGDLDGAIERWQRALASLPVTQATAHRRAGLVLAIAGAHEGLFERGGGAKELQLALWVLDEYLAGLDPTDDENRVAVEQRRAAIAEALAKARAPGPANGPTAQVETGPSRPPDRRVLLAGSVVLGLGAAGAAVMGLGLGLGARADSELAAAVALPGDDPMREQAKATALARGEGANAAALAGAVIGGVLLVAGVVLVAVGVPRARGSRARVAIGGAGLQLRF